jgi:FkbM family methyltransferase
MDYDFVEIGTSDYATLAGKATENTVGISVEPLKVYLDRLPNNKYVKKVCAAIVTEERYKISNSCKIFYIDEKNITDNRYYWLRGCNSIDAPHPIHTKFEELMGAPQPFSTDQHIIESVEVPCITFSMLARTYKIEKISLLKIDIEGGDCPLVIDIINYYKNNDIIDKLPKKIFFETNYATTTPEKVGLASKFLSEAGYKVQFMDGNTLATLK